MSRPYPVRTSALSLVAIALTVAGLTASQGQPAPPLPNLVPGTALQALLPSAPGWTRRSDQKQQISLSPTCDYTFAAVVLEKEQMRIKVTLADSGRSPDGLMVLATMVITLPEDYKESVPPASTIRRFRVGGEPAAELWDTAKNAGEITVVIDGRFVAILEGFQLESLEPLRTMLEQIDLKKVAALK